MIGRADLSECEQFRYSLHRAWDETLPTVVFIGLNPSTADALEDDPTIRRCVGFAKTWGFGGLAMINLFALRSTDPKRLKKSNEPVGQDNDKKLAEIASESSLVVAAWGVHGTLHNRADHVLRLLEREGVEVHCLGTTKDGHPRHPLYLRRDIRPKLFKATQADRYSSTTSPH